MLSSAKPCQICGHSIFEDLHTLDGASFHARCYEGVKTSGLRFTIPTHDAECLMCARPAAKGAVVVELIDTGIAHLYCFFGTRNGDARSLGAAAATRSLTERGRALRAQSDALVYHSHLLFARLRSHLLN